MVAEFADEDKAVVEVVNVVVKVESVEIAPVELLSEH